MRRMYSKEQLQKLIDEVSRLIAIEELDKVVPVPSAADNGKLIQVNATGTGYQLAAIGDLTKAYIENIYDEDEHNRFIEGTFTPAIITGVEYTYAKWSLSGSHLMIVLAFNAADGTTISSNYLTSNVNLPQWIIDKLYPGGANEKIISAKYAEQWKDQTTPVTPQLYCGLTKDTNSLVTISVWGSSIAISGKNYFRLAFDLLIDNA